MKHPVLTSEVREAHPGWAVRFSDGSWLCTSMMCSPVVDAFYATRYDSKERAEAELKSAREDEPTIMPAEAEIIEAWQPLCESLRVRIHSLNEACNISPDDLSEITWNLESVLVALKDASKKKK